MFFGPAGSSGDIILTRWFPTHFVTLWMVDLPSHHGGRLGDLGIALVWVASAIVAAAAVLGFSSRAAARSRRQSGQFVTAVRFGLVDLGRNPVSLILLIVVPAVFIFWPRPPRPHAT